MSDLIARLREPTGAILDSTYVVIASNDWERCREERDQAADLLEANAAEIEGLERKVRNAQGAVVIAKEWIAEKDAEIERLKGDIEDMARLVNAHGFENEKLRAVYKAADDQIKAQRAGLPYLQLLVELEAALAAVEQSEAGDELLEISGKPGTEERADLYSDNTQSKGSPDAWMPRR